MKTNFPERIIEMLRGSSNGLTSKDIAERLGTTAGNISSRLSKLAAYGVIGKARGTLDPSIEVRMASATCVRPHENPAHTLVVSRRRKVRPGGRWLLQRIS
jgi:transcriptional regulator